MKEWKNCYGLNVLQTTVAQRAQVPADFSAGAAAPVLAFHRQLPGYAETPLVSLPGLARRLGVRAILAKDESRRFSLNAFKGLGGSYAMFRMLCEKLSLDPERTGLRDLTEGPYRAAIRETVFATATDGNHGRGVAWAGGIFGCRVHVFMPKGSAEPRVQAIRRAGPAEVTVTDRNYDETVRLAKEQSERNGWLLIQDTSWEGYETAPSWVTRGYLTMASEMLNQAEAMGTPPTHLFLQAGVGSMAAGVLGYAATRLGEKKPVTAIVEPTVVDCVYRSARAGDGKAHSVAGDPETIMAGLNCGTPCGIAWPVLRDWADFFVGCPDYASAHGMRLYAGAEAGDPRIVSGESGASTLGAAALILSRPELKEARAAMGLNADSVLLFISTEGDTDPENYRRIVERGAYPLP